MRRAFILTLGALLASHTAYAADAVFYEEPAIPAASYDWSGFYVGLQAGYLASEFDISFEEEDLFTNPDADGFVGGVYVGYNHQFSNNWVIGLEGEYSGSSADGDDIISSTIDGPFPDETWESDISWSAAIRGRIGYAMDRTLVYAAAGAAFVEYEVGVYDVGDLRETFSDNETGWTIGAGVEHAFTQNMIARVDYRYSDFGSQTYGDNPGGTVDLDIDLATHEIKFGVAYKF